MLTNSALLYDRVPGQRTAKSFRDTNNSGVTSHGNNQLDGKAKLRNPSLLKIAIITSKVSGVDGYMGPGLKKYRIFDSIQTL